MSDDLITLYDLPCKAGNICWSPNVWKTRMLLNYKNLPYETKWIDFPDISPTLKSHGVEPKEAVVLGAPVGAEYTLPTIRLPDGAFVMDSAVIAAKLEDMYPEPSCHLETQLHEQVQAILPAAAFPLLPNFMPRIRDVLVTEHATPYFVGAREQLFGASIDEIHQDKGGEQAWTAAKPGLDELKRFLRAHKRDDGPFILGSQVSYADFVVAAVLMSGMRLGRDLFDKFVGGDEALIALWEGCQKWLERDS